MTREKIGIAMSGGVDSTVSAALLLEQGFAVHGFWMELPLPGGCEEQARRVRGLAERLGIPLHQVDLRAKFTEAVIRPFLATYLAGRTPNPCVLCNQAVKFGALFREMRSQGMTRMATGHYARIDRGRGDSPLLRRGLDPAKDQSYFLCRLDAATLAHLILPLGALRKKEVYELAARLGLSGAHGPESQDVCFLAGMSVAAFVATQNIPEQPGEIVDAAGRVIGRHRGLSHYTVGQRRGLDLPDATPWYVQALDSEHNRLLVAKGEELWSSGAVLSEVRWLGAQPVLPWQSLTQIRGRHQPVAAVLAQEGSDRWRLTFSRPQRAVTPGQFAVFYEEDVVRGSGVIVAAAPQSKVP